MAMRRFEVTILGASSALPTASRFPTSQMINCDDRYFLIDCGEGTQMQLRRCQLSIQRIEAIFISHLHGDHFFGLFGLLTSMELLGRQKPLMIYAPIELKEMLEVVLVRKLRKIQFKLSFEPIDMDQMQVLFEDDKMRIHSFPVQHGIACVGFAFVQRHTKRRLIPEKLEEFNVPHYFRSRLQLGEDYVQENGEVIPVEELSRPPQADKKYVYMTDTLPLNEVPNVVESADLLYHEATFLKKEHVRAKQTNHSTTEQAAAFAMAAKVGQLLIGHFSTRYRELNAHLEECREVFPNTLLAIEQDVHKVGG